MSSQEYTLYTHVFPFKDSDFNVYIQNTETYLQANWARLVRFRKPQVFSSQVIGSDLSDALLPPAEDPRKIHLLELCSRWALIYPRCETSVTAMKAKDQLRKKLQNILTSIFLDIPQSFLTETDRKELGFELCHVHPSHPLAVKIFWS